MNPKNTKVLITNDDGFSAHGIRILYEISCLLFKDVWLIAPATEQSGKGHSLTLRNSLQIIQKSEKKFSVDGTPADCVILGLNHLMKDDPPDLILSGINKGTNLGEDITYSGTIGAAIEATISGVPAIAFSQEINENLKNNWATSENYTLELIKKLYSSVGYNLVTVDTKFNELESANKVDLIFEINRGETTKISKIYFTGDKKIRQKRLRDIIASEESKFWKFISRNTKFSQRLVNLDLRLLSNYYKSLGYYDVKITSNSAEIKKSGNVELTYSIEAGNRYTIKKITTNVDPVFDKKLFLSLNKEYQQIIGEYYSPFKIKALLDDIDNLIEQKNLQFVEHNVEEIIEDSAIIIKFNIFEGKKVSIERINILGNNVTNESVIRSELLIDEGDPFTNLNLDKSIFDKSDLIILIKKIIRNLKLNSKELKESETQEVKYLRKKFIQKKINTYQLRKFRYDKLEDIGKFVFFPLQHYPEAQLGLLNTIHENQLNSAKIIARFLPNNLTLVVKNHPYNYEWRSRSFLMKLKNTPNVKVIDHKISNFEVYIKMDYVVSPGGTAIFATALEKKPAI